MVFIFFYEVYGPKCLAYHDNKYLRDEMFINIECKKQFTSKMNKVVISLFRFQYLKTNYNALNGTKLPFTTGRNVEFTQ
uniref:Uncharacterized protein n=1 Tax=Romanomermis culicivorax TaxID=13658 RepID=A0A915KSY3_ROMCU